MRFETVRGFLSATLCVLLPLGAVAGTVGPEFQVNTYTTYGQHFPDVSADGAGNFVIVWQTYRQDGAGGGIVGRRYDSTGAALSGEFIVNGATLDYQYGPSIAMAPAGDFVVAWSSYPSDGDLSGIFAQRFDGAGAPAGGQFQVNTETAYEQFAADVGVDAVGNFVVVWTSHAQDGDLDGIFGQRFDSGGVPQGGEFQINDETIDEQSAPTIAVDPNGNFVVVWQSFGQDGSSFGVFGQRFDSGGVPQGGEFQVNTTTIYAQKYPDISIDASGSFVVVWQSFAQDGSDYGVFGRRFDSDGIPQDGEFQVNTFTTGYQSFYEPRVAMASGGDFIVVWDSAGQDGSGFGIFAQQYDDTGTPQGAELPINTTTFSDQTFPAIAAGGNGDFVVAWGSYAQDGNNYGVFAQRLCTNLPDEVANLLIAPAGAGQIMLSWDALAGVNDYSVFSDTVKNGAFSTPVAGSPTTMTSLTISSPAGNVFYLVAGGNDCGLGPK